MQSPQGLRALEPNRCAVPIALRFRLQCSIGPLQSRQSWPSEQRQLRTAWVVAAVAKDRSSPEEQELGREVLSLVAHEYVDERALKGRRGRGSV